MKRHRPCSIVAILVFCGVVGGCQPPPVANVPPDAPAAPIARIAGDVANEDASGTRQERIGTELHVPYGTYVTLDGSGSTDSNGDHLSYRWSQTDGGTRVDLEHAASVRASFWAPCGDDDLLFSLVVSDGSAESRATVFVSVNPPTARVTDIAEAWPRNACGRSCDPCDSDGDCADETSRCVPAGPGGSLACGRPCEDDRSCSGQMVCTDGQCVVPSAAFDCVNPGPRKKVRPEEAAKQANVAAHEEALRQCSPDPEVEMEVVVRINRLGKAQHISAEGLDTKPALKACVAEVVKQMDFGACRYRRRALHTAHPARPAGTLHSRTAGTSHRQEGRSGRRSQQLEGGAGF